MIAIACIDAKNGIGKDGKLLVSIPEDMAFFRKTTINNVVIMGRKTLFSFKNKAPLKNRINIIFTRNKNLQNEYKNYDNIYFVNSIMELNNILKFFPDKKTYVIGGADIYQQLLPFCDTALITQLDNVFEANAYFPVLEKNNFEIVNASEQFTYENINYKFITYKRKS